MKNLIAILFVILGSALSADDGRPEIIFFGSFLHSPDVPNALFFFAEIEANDSFELRRALRTHDIDTIVLASPGGSVWEGLTMAGIIFDRDMTTYIPDLSNGRGCVSACAFMFFAGHERLASGKLAVHQVGGYDPEVDNAKRKRGETQQATQFTTSEVIGFLNEFQTPPWVYERMFRSRDFYYFTTDEKKILSSGQIDPLLKSSIDSFLEALTKKLDEQEEKLKHEHISEGLDIKKQEDVRAFQALLNTAKCSAGPNDGVWGRRTANAAKRFAETNKLNFSGPKSLGEGYMSILSSDERKNCPPLPTPKPSHILAKRWQLDLACNGKNIGGNATLSFQRKASGREYYSMFFSNSLGGKYRGVATVIGNRFTYSVTMSSSTHKVSGEGKIYGVNRSFVTGQSSEGCQFYAKAKL